MNFKTADGAELCLPVPSHWGAHHDPAAQTIVLSNGMGSSITFGYQNGDKQSWFNKHVMVRKPGYGHKWRVSNALEGLADGARWFE